MNPVVGNIRKEWDWVKEALEPMFEQFHWVDFRPEDVYESCLKGESILYTTDETFAIFTIEEHPVTSKKTFFFFIAWKKEGSKDVIEKHLDFFVRVCKKYECNRIGVKTAITGVEKLLLNTGWRCDMKNFSKKIKK